MGGKQTDLTIRKWVWAYAQYVADGVSLSGKAQNAIVKKLRKLGRKLRYGKQLVYTHFEGSNRNDFCFTDTVEEARKDEVWFTYHIK